MVKKLIFNAEVVKAKFAAIAIPVVIGEQKHKS